LSDYGAETAKRKEEGAENIGLEYEGREYESREVRGNFR